jgi:HPt (histidine-containing phosphotransfer) domain-containing protein
MSSPRVSLRLPAPRDKAIDVAAALTQVGGDYDFVMAVMRDEFLCKAWGTVGRCAENSLVADACDACCTSGTSTSTSMSEAEQTNLTEVLSQIAFDAHSMKGSAATLHANQLSEACHVLEQTAKFARRRGNVDAAHEKIAFVNLTQAVSDRLAELERDVADLAFVVDVDVAHASETLGDAMFHTLTRLAGDAVSLVTSAALFSIVAAARSSLTPNALKRESGECAAVRERCETITKDASSVGARALVDAVREFVGLVFSVSDDCDDGSVSNETKHTQTADAVVELRRCASNVAFDAAAVVSREGVFVFLDVVKGRIATETHTDRKGASDADESFKQFSHFELVDQSARRLGGFVFDAANERAAVEGFVERCVSSTKPKETHQETPPTETPKQQDSTQKPKETREETLSETRASAETAEKWDTTETKQNKTQTHTQGGETPMNFPSTVAALDGDASFAGTMLRRFLTASEKFALAIDFGATDGRGLNGEHAPTRCTLSSERRVEAHYLTETADWLGAPPLRAAIAALLEENASEDAVRAARAAVRDLRVFADELEKRGFGTCGTQQPTTALTAPLPKKTATTEAVMRSGLYAARDEEGTTPGVHDSSTRGSGSVGGSVSWDGFGGGRSCSSRNDSFDFRSDGSVGSSGEDEFGGNRSAARPRRVSHDPSSTSASGSEYSRRASFDSFGVAEGAVGALASLSPRARARGLSALRMPRQRNNRRITFDVRKALTMADGNWAYAIGCAGRHASSARAQIAVLKAVLVGGDEALDPYLLLPANGVFEKRDDAKTLQAAMTQLRSLAGGARVSHAPRLMDAVEALAATLVTAANEPESDLEETGEFGGFKQKTRPGWRLKSKKLTRTLERRCEEYHRAVVAVAACSRAFSPRFVFMDVANGSPNVAIEKLRVFALAARTAHVAVVRAVAAAESAFASPNSLGGEVGGSSLETQVEDGHDGTSSSGGEECGGDFGETEKPPTRKRKPETTTKKSSFASNVRFSVDRPIGSHERFREKPTLRKDGDGDVHDDLRHAFLALQKCEATAGLLCARPSERAFRAAAARVSRIAAAVGAERAVRNENGIIQRVPRVPLCFTPDEHADTVMALSSLKREVEAVFR